MDFAFHRTQRNLHPKKKNLTSTDVWIWTYICKLRVRDTSDSGTPPALTNSSLNWPFTICNKRQQYLKKFTKLTKEKIIGCSEIFTFPATPKSQCFNREATESKELFDIEAHKSSPDKPYESKSKHIRKLNLQENNKSFSHSEKNYNLTVQYVFPEPLHKTKFLWIRIGHLLLLQSCKNKFTQNKKAC